MDQGWHSNENCQRTAPRHLLDLPRKPQHRWSCPLTRIWKFFQNPPCPKVFLVCLHLPEKMDAPALITTIGAFDSKNLHLQPSSRLPSFAEFCSDLLASKTHVLLYEWSGGTNFILSAKSRRMSSRCWTSMCFHSQFLNLFIEKVLFGWCGCQLFWIHGGWVREISWSPSTQSYLCVPHRCCLTHQLVRSDLCQSGLAQIFGGCIHECRERNFLNNRTPISARFGHGVCGLVRIFFTLCIR